MRTMATGCDEDSQDDPLQDVPDIERMIVNRGIIPESLLFWRRWRHPKPA